MNYTYETNHKHAVTNMSSGENYGYDANGNQTQRMVGGNTYNLSYDAENRLVGVSGAATATFVYDGTETVSANIKTLQGEGYDCFRYNELCRESPGALGTRLFRMENLNHRYER